MNLSYKTSEELNRIIDKSLPGRPAFKRRVVITQGEASELYHRDVMGCVRALWGDPEFTGDLILEPERHYADENETIRMYHDMHTAKWWWKTQVSFSRCGYAPRRFSHPHPQNNVEHTTKKKNATIVPIIISSDKTQLTTFRNKTAYPVYLTLGNLPKNIRHKLSRQGQILLGYLLSSTMSPIRNHDAARWPIFSTGA